MTLICFCSTQLNHAVPSPAGVIGTISTPADVCTPPRVNIPQPPQRAPLKRKLSSSHTTGTPKKRYCQEDSPTQWYTPSPISLSLGVLFPIPLNTRITIRYARAKPNRANVNRGAPVYPSTPRLLGGERWCVEVNGMGAGGVCASCSLLFCPVHEIQPNNPSTTCPVHEIHSPIPIALRHTLKIFFKTLNNLRLCDCKLVPNI